MCMEHALWIFTSFNSPTKERETQEHFSVTPESFPPKGCFSSTTQPLISFPMFLQGCLNEYFKACMGHRNWKHPPKHFWRYLPVCPHWQAWDLLPGVAPVASGHCHQDWNSRCIEMDSFLFFSSVSLSPDYK